MAKAISEVSDPALDPAINSQVKAFLRHLNSSDAKPMEQLSPVEARGVLEGAQQSVRVDVSGVDVEERTITEDGVSVGIRIIRPAGVKERLPAFMFFHGGGWVLGDFPTHQRFIRDLVVYAGLPAIYVDYDRSPEAKFPTAINQAYAATKWVAGHGDEINVDGKRLAVVGNSVGGNMSAVVALMAKERGGPDLRLQFLFWPVTNADFDTSSYHQYATGRFLTRNMMIWFWDNYLNDKSEGVHKYASPLRASLEELKGLPPAIIQTAENDVLRDEGEAYARKLDEADVPVTLVRYQGMIHDYGLLNPLADIPAVQNALLSAAAAIRVALQG
ncbi:alpha/beta hydrolase [Chitinophaga pendula]|uniref:alpha/beta hydrolase n=1 Tax=Chitinophaga TaxID=79328 RepID=UPI000BAEA7AC|nr:MULTISPECIES: alpha/beta hydrolase [Chitinophaga]ASZ11711.1 alpha/beta hydrolase [Chitinophaga sp. MD30]UCJ05271.1 alpha/beta hydrolase [Chitinophaga pendula]